MSALAMKAWFTLATGMSLGLVAGWLIILADFGAFWLIVLATLIFAAAAISNEWRTP